MNGSKAKKLRRAAEKLTIGEKHTSYKLKKVKAGSRSNYEGLVGLLTLSPNCTRRVYQDLKKIS